MKDLANTLQEYENEYILDRKNKKSTLYMMDSYNIKTFYPQNKVLVPEAVARINNALIEGLNHNHVLPKFKIAVIDKDLIEDLNIFDYGAHKALALHVDTLIKNVDVTIRCKCLQLLERCPGAVLDEYQPTIIYVTMIHQVEHYHKVSLLAKICSLGNKFNDLLNNYAAKRDHRILSIRSCTGPEHFTESAMLSKVGKEAFWWELDDLMECFEKDKVKLRPKPKNRELKKSFAKTAPSNHNNFHDYDMQAQKSSDHCSNDR